MSILAYCKIVISVFPDCCHLKSRNKLTNSDDSNVVLISTTLISRHSLLTKLDAQEVISTLTMHTLHKRPSAYVCYLCYTCKSFPWAVRTYSIISSKIINIGPCLLAHAQWFWVVVSRPSGMKQTVVFFMTTDCPPLLFSSWRFSIARLQWWATLYIFAPCFSNLVLIPCRVMYWRRHPHWPR